ncbi:tRNA (adenosine(37)-N6)-threonylcarbamoyltransferase complex ATPase subunit type 1 TsaE [Salinibacter sp. 10B]|uniref:tRNA (adenosine(37)-N6)-threonylcarbamoyltransferase complex ATPase subunit type 1 TsaE n=1 Tax=Salinibacter sp. 10B TaxID=1923971 RepID=UPI000CF563E7|nr:tRNA (adenosine(37)-N6)-threonylcarbamoyltransferase complex ATPase subunit type 1 TsaE [Salinibacter sp. 10B]PQJ36109.1 tRNA (adenosine(37)-N6)-threonylcarbamoyltransferase complex ATPase subunit type 1 TsaE [Salinibacter sp. 10B]
MSDPPSPSDCPLAGIQSLLPATTQSASETQNLGTRLAETLSSGAVVALYGDLGTGKTQLVKGIAEGLGLSAAAVRSPTFTILHTYENGRCPLYHFDAYRVQSPDEFTELGFEEYVHGSGITCIEWADRVESLLPAHTLHLALTHVAAHQRRLTLRKHTKR